MTTQKTPKAKGTNLELDSVHDRGERLTDLALIDSMNEMKSRCFGLSAAVKGIGVRDSNEREGVCYLADDIAYGMERLSAVFEAERKLRIAEASE